MTERELSGAASAALILCLILPGPCDAQRQLMPDAHLFEILYEKINGIVASGAQNGSPQLVLAAPGVLLEPWAEVNTPADRYELFLLSDEALDTSGIYHPVGRRVSETYSLLLDKAEPDVPELTAAEKQRLAKARLLLYISGDAAKGETEAYKKYKEYAQQYRQVEAQLAKQRKNGAPSSVQTAARSTLLNEWRTLGRKNEIESALSVVNRPNASSWWEELRKRYANQLLSGTEGTPTYPRTHFEPEFSSWFADEGWTTFTLSDASRATVEDRENLWPSGWGMWSFDAGNGKTFRTSKINSYRVQVDLKRVAIVRPWLDSMLFDGRWRWKETSAARLPDGTQALIPCLPTALVLARNLRLNAAWPQDELAFARERLRKKEALAWGPFALGGKALPSSSETYFRALPPRSGFSLEAPQLLGWICQPLLRTRQVN